MAANSIRARLNSDFPDPTQSIVDENPTVQDALPAESVTGVCAKNTPIIQISGQDARPEITASF